MSYATPAQMIARFGDGEMMALSDRVGAGGVDLAVVQGALDEAGAEIDPYLAPRYALPLLTVPRIVAGFACDIARYRLAGAGGTTVTDEVRHRYKDAIAFLDRVARGQIGLGLDAASHTAQSSNTVHFATPTVRVFDRASRQ